MAHPSRLDAVKAQAELLGRAGAPADAARRLRRGLAEIAGLPGAEEVAASVRDDLAWYTFLSPLATHEELETASAGLEATLALLDRSPTAGLAARAGERLELANRHVNRALLAVRLGRSPHAAAREARRLVGETPDLRGREILGWAALAEAQALLADGRPAAAAERCAALAGAEAADLPRLTAWAYGCLGRARRAQGDLEAAREALSRALELHRRAEQRVGPRLALRPGRRAEDLYAAVRVAVELGDPASAWGILAELDGAHPVLGGCASRGTAAARRRLEARLRALETPAAAPRRRQREPLAQGLRERLQELARSQTAVCPEEEVHPGHGELAAPGPLLRAVPLPDEVLLLERGRSGGAVRVYRNPLPRQERLRRLAAPTEPEDAVPGSPADAEAAWRERLAPFAAALVPPTLAEGDEPLVWALHGELQDVPLAALPWPVVASAEGSVRWLGEALPVAVWPALGTRAAVGAGRPADAVATVVRQSAPEPFPAGFLLDPLRDLPRASANAGFYRRTFPGALVVTGDRVDAPALAAALARAERLHLGLHGTYDPAFPELSGLVLSDGSLSLLELASLPGAPGFVDLSACRTGSWPLTADAGGWGFAGHFARRGAAWVVASRGDLDDTVAAAFDRRLYRALATGASVPAAYREAVRGTAARHPVAGWAPLVLVAGPGGGSAPERTPFKDEAAAMAHGPDPEAAPRRGEP